MRKDSLLTLVFYCWLIVACVPLHSCAKYTVAPSGRDPADITYKKKVAASYIWGIINKPHSVVDSTCGTTGLAEVKYTSHLGYSLIHILTLGMVHLVKVEWKCQKEPPIVGHQP